MTPFERGETTTVRLVVADSQPVVRAGLSSFFANTDVRIVGEAQTGEQVVAKTFAERPDVLLLDVQFPDFSGFQAVERLRDGRFDGRVVFFARYEQQTYFARAFAVGADSYLLKKTSRAELLRVLRALAVGENVAAFSGELRRVSTAMRRREIASFEDDAFNPLTPRETQVLRCVAFGLSNKEIAAALKLSVDTVKEHVQNVLRKLEARDRAQAAVWAVRNKIV